MRLLLIATGYLPYCFSENLCNGKLVYAMQRHGWSVDVITRKDNGPTYSAQWQEPWLCLRQGVHEVCYETGGVFGRTIDTLRSALKLRIFPIEGIRWASYAYELALKLCRRGQYDVVLTRSPSDIPHIVGLRLRQKLGIRWIANWNDPAVPIWPEPYTHHFSKNEQKRKMHFTEICLKGAEVNSFPSKFLLDHFISYFPFLSSQKCAVIPHIVFDGCIIPKSIVKSFGSKFRMCHSGNLSIERNPELTFRALRELIDEGNDKIEFALMGHVNEYTQTLIRKYNLEDFVKCLGGFPYMEALQKMQEYDCLVLLEAKLEKGIFFASKFTDYAQLGKPILAISPVDGFANTMIQQYGGGVCVNNEDSQSIKTGILVLYRMWCEQKLSDISTETLYEQFSTKRIIDIYDELLR